MSLPQAYIPGQAFEPKLQPESHFLLLGKNERSEEIRHLQHHRNGVGVERAVPSHRLLKPRGADPQLLQGKPLGFRSRGPSEPRNSFLGSFPRLTTLDTSREQNVP